MADFRRFVVEEYPVASISKEEIAKAKTYIATIEVCIEKANAKYKQGDIVFKLVDSIQEESAAYGHPLESWDTISPDDTVVYGVKLGETSPQILEVIRYKDLAIPTLEAIQVALQDSGLLLNVNDKNKNRDDYYHGIVAVVTVE